MESISRLWGLAQSILFAAERNPLKIPNAVRSVLHARRAYNIGPMFHSLYALYNKPESSWKDYVLETISNRELLKISPDYKNSITTNKLLFTEHCLRNKIPAVPILFTLRAPSDKDPTRNGHPVNADTWKKEIEPTLPECIFVKPIDGAHGTGAFMATRRESKWRVGERELTADEVYSTCIKQIEEKEGSALLIQPAIRPHHKLAEIMTPGSLGTLRAVTYMDKSEPKLAFPCLRIPARGNITDNFSLGKSGNLVAAIDIETGILKEARISTSIAWPAMTSTTHHPDTGKKIAGLRIPFWEETKELMLHGQRVTESPRTIGWDIAITESGPVVVEGNSLYGTDILQVAYDKGLRHELENIFNAVRDQPGSH